MRPYSICADKCLSKNEKLLTYQRNYANIPVCGRCAIIALHQFSYVDSKIAGGSSTEMSEKVLFCGFGGLDQQPLNSFYLKNQVWNDASLFVYLGLGRSRFLALDHVVDKIVHRFID